MTEYKEIETTVGNALATAARRIPGETPRLEAEILLAHILGQSRAWILAHPEVLLKPGKVAEFDSTLSRLADGEPLAYITGYREFFGLDFLVTRDVLVPRPETELLVEYALAAIGERRVAGDGPPFTLHASRFTTIADIGAGSGCIAVSLAVNLPEASIIATDISSAALAVARANAARHGVAERIDFKQGDLLDPIAGPVDLLCANLPYIDSDELSALTVARNEPRLALDGGIGGTELVERFLAAAPGSLNPGGMLLLEIGATQAEAVSATARAAFPGATVEIHKDLASLPRLVSIHL
ncbi:MAG: peptide chain release factor N(5)-glutamine methyltransferase [Chloroflexi bacterium]|nr:peptide chain release factor N(5)-glutamine methyltransferase [Chloroflexota bacterium]